MNAYVRGNYGDSAITYARFGYAMERAPANMRHQSADPGFYNRGTHI